MPVAVNCWVWVVPVARIMLGLAGVTVMDESVTAALLAAALLLAAVPLLWLPWPPPHCINAADIINDRYKTNTIFGPLFINILLCRLLFHLKVRDFKLFFLTSPIYHNIFFLSTHRNAEQQ